MQRLTGFDASFLYAESVSAPMHTLKIAIFETDDEWSWERVRAGIERHLDALPPFRQRLIEIPLGLGHPVWIEDPEFDLDRHLHRRRLAPPGGARELDDLVATLAERPLERDRPLWEVTYVEGLEGGRVAFVAKLHHAIADGARALELLRGLVDWDGSRASSWSPENVPERGALIRLSLVNGLRRLALLPDLLVRTVRGFFRRLRAALRSPVRLPAAFAGPIGPMNHSLRPGRRFATARLPLETVLRIKRQAGVTVNDVLLEICAGSLRRYLSERGPLPSRSLLVSVPVDTRMPARVQPGSNHVGHITGTLRTDEADPLKRLRGIAEVMREAKARHSAQGGDLLEQWAEFASPGMFRRAARTFSRLGLADRIRPPVNLVVSNVAGPREVLTLEGARLVALYSVGPILEGIGLNITSWSYAGQLHFALLCDDRGDLDPAAIAALLEGELSALQRAVEAASAPDGASLTTWPGEDAACYTGVGAAGLPH